MTTPAAPPRPNTRQGQPPHPGGAQPAVPPIPFPIAARRKVALGPGVSVVNMATVAGTNVNLGPIEITPTGFLRYIDLYVSAVASGNAATVAFAADAPFNAITQVTLTNAAGDTIIVPVDGYALYLFKKYGALSEDPPYGDPRANRYFKATAGVGSGAGGSFSFNLRVPLEIDPETAFGSVASMASNKTLQLGAQVAPTSVVYSTAPTNAPAVTVSLYQWFWAQPRPDNGRGQPQATVPDGNNSLMMWRLETPGVAPGDQIKKLNNTGNVMRLILFVYRTAAGARTDADIPALHTFRLNNDELHYLPDAVWINEIQSAYGYMSASNDVANGLDTGVRPYHYFMSSDGRIRCSSSREQYLPTLDSTLFQYRGQNFGANMSTLYVYTCEIKPASALALYQRT